MTFLAFLIGLALGAIVWKLSQIERHLRLMAGPRADAARRCPVCRGVGACSEDHSLL